MSVRIAVITNSIRRSLELVEKGLRASVAQAGIEAVIFVDQNETPLDLPEDLRRSTKLKIIHAVVPGVSQARNLAVYPNVDWLVFCDDDGYMAPDYAMNLEKLILAHPEVDIFCGSIKRIDTGDFYSKRHAIGGDMSHFWNSKLLMGSNFCVKRTTFEALGKFDESFGAGAKYGSSEETDFAWNAFFNNRKMFYAQELVVYHVPPFAGQLKNEEIKAFAYGIGKGALVSKWLIKKSKAIVLFELLEMLTYPVVRSFYDLIKMDLSRIKINIFTFRGRIVGIFRYFA